MGQASCCQRHPRRRRSAQTARPRRQRHRPHHNYRTRVTEVPSIEDSRRAIGLDGTIELAWHGAEPDVSGYQGEPYLRFDNSGVSATRSPATYSTRTATPPPQYPPTPTPTPTHSGSASPRNHVGNGTITAPTG